MAVNLHEATCDPTGVTRLDVTLAGGDDHVDASGVPIAALIRGGSGNDTIRGGSGFHVPTSNRMMKLSRSWATNSVFESGENVIPCGCFPTLIRTSSFIATGSMIEVESPRRLFTATYLPSGEAAIWCGSLPTGILATRANLSFGAPSSTQTCSVVSLATKTRSLLYAGPDGAGDGAAAASVAVAVAVASAISAGLSPGVGVAGSSAASIEQAPITTARTASKDSERALIPYHHHTSRARAEP